MTDTNSISVAEALEVLAEADELEASDEEIEPLALDVAAADFSDWEPFGSVSQREAAVDAEPTLFVTEEQYEKYEEGRLSREELGAREEDTITTIRQNENLISKLFTPRSRAVLLDEWLFFGAEAVTVSEVVERSDQLTRQTAYDHVEALEEMRVLVEDGMKGNATAYRLNIRNPVVQCVQMLANVGRFGETRLLLEREFLAPGTDGEGMTAPEMDAE